LAGDIVLIGVDCEIVEFLGFEFGKLEGFGRDGTVDTTLALCSSLSFNGIISISVGFIGTSFGCSKLIEFMQCKSIVVSFIHSGSAILTLEEKQKMMTPNIKLFLSGLCGSLLFVKHICCISIVLHF
jgi:hypothetical protein